MADPGCPQRHTLRFLSTLLSQKVPEKSDVVLRCMIAGQPKPEVTWYKNGQAIDSGNTVSSYEFFENQYIHLLHLPGCAQSDAAVYQVSARSCVGMICCSASLEVQCLQDPQVSPDPGGGGDVAGECETEIREEDSTRRTDEKWNPCKTEESMAAGAYMPTHSSPDKFDPSCSPQIVVSHDSAVSDSENPQYVKEARQRTEPFNSDNMQASSFNSNIEKQDVSQLRTAHATVSGLTGDGLGHEEPNESVTPSHQTPKAQKYISFSLPLPEATLYPYPSDSNSINMQPGPQVPSEDSDSDYELCPEITLTYTEEFSDDDLEYLECSDVMTDYSNAVWQRNLQGTDRVFLLESDDEEMEFNECGPGGCEHFFSEMGCGPQVSGGMWSMNVATGFCSYRSQPQEVGDRSSGTSRHSPLPLHSEMTLTLGPHQDGIATMTEPGRAPLPTASEAVENDCSGIRGETRDKPEAGEEFSSDNLQTMDKAETEASAKPLSGGSDKSEAKQGLKSLAGERTEEKYPGSRKTALRPTRARWPGMKANVKKQLLKDGPPKGTLDPLPKEPTKQPLTRSYGQEPAHTETGAPGWNSHFREVCIPLPAEQDSKTPRPPADPLSKEGDSSFEGGGALLSTLSEASQIPDQTAGRLQETIGENSYLDQTPAFSVPAEEESTFTGVQTHFVSNLTEIDRGNSSLAQYLGLESCPQSPQQESRQNREGDRPGALWAESAQELRPLEDNDEEVSQAPASVALPQGDGTHFRESEALSDAFSQPTAPSLPLENVDSGSRGREAACVMGCFEAGDQETCYATMDLPVGAPVDKYLPEEICPMDLELTEGQREVCDLCSPDKILAVLQAQGSESPQATYKHSEDGKSAEGALFHSTLAWDTSPEAREDATGGTAADTGNSPSIFSSTLLYNVGGFGEIQAPCSENISFVNSNEGGYGSSNLSVPIAIDTLASYGSIRECSEEQSTEPAANVDCHQVTRETEGILTDATEVHKIKCRTVSVPHINDFVDGADQVSCEAQDEENSPSLPDDPLSSFTGEATRETLVPAPSDAGTHGHFLLPEGQGLYLRPLQIDTQPGYESQTVEGAHSGGLEEDFQEKGNGTKQCIRPQSTSHQGSLSANDFQESLPSIPAMQQEVNVEPFEHSPADSGEETECSSDQRTSVSVLAEKTMGEGSPLVSSVPALPDILLGEKDGIGLGSWSVGSKVKIITLEAPVFEIWPPELVTHSGYKEAEVGLTAPGRSWALSDILRAGTRPKPGALGVTTWVPSPKADAIMALGNNRDICEDAAPDRQAYCNSQTSQCLGQPRLLESSVDPVEEKELNVTDSPSETSRTGEVEMAETTDEEQGGRQHKLPHPTVANQSVNFPRILESSVDPIDDRGGKPEPSDSNIEASESTTGNMCQRVDIQTAHLRVPHPQDNGEIIPNENTTNQTHVDRERADAKASQHNAAKDAIWQGQCPGEERQGIPSVCTVSPTQDGGDRSLGEAGQRGKDETEVTSPMSPLSNCPAGMTYTSVTAETSNSTGHIYGGSEPRTHQRVIPVKREKGTIENKCGKHVPSSNDLTDTLCTSSPKGNVTRSPTSPRAEELKSEELQIAETKPLNSSDPRTMTLAFISGEHESEKDPESLLLKDLCQKGSTLESGKKSREEQQRPVVANISKAPGAQSAIAGSEEGKKQEASGSGHLAAGIKKKILSRVAALRLRLEEKERVKNSTLRKAPKFERSLSRTDEKRDPRRAPCKAEGKAPVLLKKIQAEPAPEHSGNIMLTCQFSEIHEDSTVCWTKDSKSIAQLKKSAGDSSSVSLAIAQAGQKDQGLYYCCVKNSYGKVTAEFNLTAEVLKQLSSHTEYRGCEEIEFSQLIFKEDVFNDSYFGDHLRGQIFTEELHFGEGVHRKAFRSTVMQGLMPVFQPGHACVLKVHNAVAHGTRNNDELVQRNYKLAAQECYVQNTARYYAKIYAAEAQPLEGFGEVPEIIPIFLIRRPENNIPYATVEEELIGEFVKYSIRDGKEINFLRRDSEAGQKCCTFQHWVYQKTSGCLLVTDMQGEQDRPTALQGLWSRGVPKVSFLRKEMRGSEEEERSIGYQQASPPQDVTHVPLRTMLGKTDVRK